MKRINILFAILFATVSLSAQEEKLNAIIEVENEYNPVETKATKHSFTPQTESSKESTPLGLVFSQKATPYTLFIGDRNVKEAMPKQEKEFPGYARLGYGNNNNIDAKLGYRYVASERDILSGIASFDGFKSKMKGLHNRWDSRMFDTRVNADYIHKFNKLAVGVSAGMINRAFNYQSLATATAGSSKQRSNRYNIVLSAESFFTGPFSFDAKVGYNLNSRQFINGTNSVIMEHNVSGEGTLAYEIISKYINNAGLTFDIDGFFYNNRLLQNNTTGYKDYLAIRLNPFANFALAGWKMHAGLHIDMFTTHRGFMAIAPDFGLEKNINNIVNIYASVTGGRTSNDFATLEKLSPYWEYLPNASQRIVPTYRIVDVKAGARFNVEPFTVNLYTGYAFTKDDILATDAESLNNIYSSFGQYNTNNIHVGTRLACDYAGWFNIYADARYDFWSSNADRSWLKYKPEVTIDACAEARLFKGFYANIGYKFTSFSRGNTGRIPFVNNLSAKISYDFLQRYSVYVQGNNLINSKYFIFPGYYAQGVNIIGGLSINF